ncbi:uncharacterized protein PGTG_19873 [Puccinia graminis f. sp. tritici CRL 75-36-700-3]|uniref:Uncharacterized protein n=1 Tax=Puccinia graminis f. sp. tritici (strain CRL 75-36-700-3 / race SCCL) TaxID=418459 RepID=E3LBB3_PUCGT|nr:uncharacterized protein PGTG_19873 [Puccinia graminis f. sp. tritici CRL 75-36-700-3]EFP93838.1 hypothetical protein PGTG_19873 [Puccinia graminis f. sp. tritici CRL 75-36-700-3]
MLKKAGLYTWGAVQRGPTPLLPVDPTSDHCRESDQDLTVQSFPWTPPLHPSNLTTSPSIGGPVPGWRKRPSQSKPPKEGLAHNVGVVAWKLGVLCGTQDTCME